MSSPKVDLAVASLQELIMRGEFKPGDRLPCEAELSARLGISRNTLREAARTMSAMRIIDVRQGDGTFVSSLDPSKMIEALGLAIDVCDVKTVDWLLEIRMLIEIHAAAIAATRRTPLSLARLNEAQDGLVRASTTDAFLKADSVFHHTIAEMSGNPILVALLNLVSTPALRAHIWQNRISTGHVGDFLAEHEAIVYCVQERNTDGAKSAMFTHLSGTKARPPD